MKKDEFLSKLARVQTICVAVEDLMSNSKRDHFEFSSEGAVEEYARRYAKVAGEKERGTGGAFWWVRNNYDSVSADIFAASYMASSADALLEELYDAVNGGLE